MTSMQVTDISAVLSVRAAVAVAGLESGVPVGGSENGGNVCIALILCLLKDTREAGI